MSSETVYFHAPCLDGIFSAYFYNNVRNGKEQQADGKTSPAIIYRPCHEKAKISLPKNTGDKITFLDMCPHMETARELVDKKYASVTIIDHHLANLPVIEFLKSKTGYSIVFTPDRSSALSVLCLYDSKLTEGEGREKERTIARYLDDRDRHEYKMPNTRDVITYINSYLDPVGLDWSSKMILSSLEHIRKTFFTEGSPSIMEMTTVGKAFAEHDRIIVDRLTRTARLGTLYTPSGKTYRIVHVCSSTLCYEIFRKLMSRYAAEIDLVLCWSFDPVRNVFHFDMRSDNDHANVQSVCVEFGGRGRRNAATCVLQSSFSKWIEELYK